MKPNKLSNAGTLNPSHSDSVRLLRTKEPDVNSRSLDAEINNGRLVPCHALPRLTCATGCEALCIFVTMIIKSGCTCPTMEVDNDPPKMICFLCGGFNLI